MAGHCRAPGPGPWRAIKSVTPWVLLGGEEPHHSRQSTAAVE